MSDEITEKAGLRMMVGSLEVAVRKEVRRTGTEPWSGTGDINKMWLRPEAPQPLCSHQGEGFQGSQPGGA